MGGQWLKMVLHGNLSTLNRIWLSMMINHLMINHLISGHLIFRQIHIPFILIEPGWTRLKQTVEYRIHLRRSLTMSDPLLAQDWFPSRWFSGDWKQLKMLGVPKTYSKHPLSILPVGFPNGKLSPPGKMKICRLSKPRMVVWDRTRILAPYSHGCASLPSRVPGTSCNCEHGISLWETTKPVDPSVPSEGVWLGYNLRGQIYSQEYLDIWIHGVKKGYPPVN